MGLRLTEGVVLERVGPAIDRRAVERLERQGMLSIDAGRLRVTPPAMLVLNRILTEIAT
jgi:coproporphyrinogen III oxidase-like Fe-S oxidoreductase